MNCFTTIDIEKGRDGARRAYPRYRDALDPMGQEDARLQMNEPTAPPPPPPIPRLSFRNTHVSPSYESECDNTPHPPPPYQGYKHYCCQETSRFNLAPPSPARRQPSQPRSPVDTLTLNFTINLGSRSLTSSPIEESYQNEEAKMVVQLKQLVTTYERLLEKIEKELETAGLKHDEMAACDAWWNETSEKLDATRNLLDRLTSV